MATRPTLDDLPYEVVPSGCWVWQGHYFGGPRHPKRYGRVRLGKRDETAHRYVYKLAVGPIPAGLVLDHLCFNRNCVNPSHLEPVTQSVNVIRANGGLIEKCPYGHPYDEANTYHHGGKRFCRKCHARRSRERRARQKLRSVGTDDPVTPTPEHEGDNR